MLQVMYEKACLQDTEREHQEETNLAPERHLQFCKYIERKGNVDCISDYVDRSSG